MSRLLLSKVRIETPGQAAEAPPPPPRRGAGGGGGDGGGGGPSGALLLAVLRGRSSEGLNFSHDHARAVVMVSIAYPPIRDIKVASKRSRMLGAEWCTAPLLEPLFVLVRVFD
jgi:hypothetical protein